MDQLYTTNQLAKLFGVVPTTVIDWIEAGKLEAFKTLGGHRRITHLAVMDFLRKNELPSPPAFSEMTSKIVILDDEPEILKLFGRILTHGLPDVETIMVGHPVKALTRIGAEAPQLVVFDIHMPDMDGFEFCRQLRAEYGSAVRLLAVSGDTSDETRDRILAMGADRFLPKPEAPASLLTWCQELLAPQTARAKA